MVIQVHAQHGGNLIRFTIDIPWGLYILEKRKTVGFKMRRLERAPASLDQFMMHLLHFGVRLESIGYYRQHWERRVDLLDLVLGSDFVQL